MKAMQCKKEMQSLQTEPHCWCPHCNAGNLFIFFLKQQSGRDTKHASLHITECNLKCKYVQINLSGPSAREIIQDFGHAETS